MTREEILRIGFFDGSEKGDKRFLSNYHYTEIVYNGLRVPSTEHAYQMMKATNNEDKLYVAFQPTANMARKAGKKITCRSDWESIKVDVMREVNRIKYQDPELREKLIATGDDELVEYNWWGDIFWGVCEGKGKNMLGKILMELREELRNSKAPNGLGILLTK